MIAYGYILRELQNEGSGLKAAEAAQFEKIKQLIPNWLDNLSTRVSCTSCQLGVAELTLRETDIINKVGLGVLVLGMARIKSGEKV